MPLTIVMRTKFIRHLSLAAFSVALLLCLSACGSKSSSSSGPIRPPPDVAAVRAKADAGDPQAQAQLGGLYAKGEGVTNSYKEAAKWYRLAAEKGNADAQEGLAELYDAGQGVEKDPAQAIKWYRLAALQGNVQAQYNLGCVYGTGRTVPFDQPEAAKWLLMAANAGDALAQLNVGERYERGVGVKADRIEAFKWYTLGAGQGQTDSARRADKLKSSMSSEEIAEAKRRIASLSPTNSVAPSK